MRRQEQKGSQATRGAREAGGARGLGWPRAEQDPRPWRLPGTPALGLPVGPGQSRHIGQRDQSPRETISRMVQQPGPQVCRAPRAPLQLEGPPASRAYWRRGGALSKPRVKSYSWMRAPSLQTFLESLSFKKCVPEDRPIPCVILVQSPRLGPQCGVP